MTKPRYLTVDGETKTAGQWAKTVGLSHGAILFRIDSLGMSAEDAVKRPKYRAPKNGLWDGANELPWEEDKIAQELVRYLGRGMTLEEVGKCLGTCRERVRQIEERALRKLRKRRDLPAEWLEILRRAG